jgi:hypothetical protein
VDAFLSCTFLRPGKADRTKFKYYLDMDTVHVDTVICPVTVTLENKSSRIFRIGQDQLGTVAGLLKALKDCEVMPAGQSWMSTCKQRGRSGAIKPTESKKKKAPNSKSTTSESKDAWTPWVMPELDLSDFNNHRD